MSEAGEDERPFEVAMDGPSPLEQFATREDRAEVAEVLLRLEPNYREVLTLRFHEELSLEEIASVTRAPLSTVKSRLYRGLAALKPEVEQLRRTHAITGGRDKPMNSMEQEAVKPCPRLTERELDQAERQARTVTRGDERGGLGAMVNRTHRVVRERAQEAADAAEQGAQPVDSAGDVLRRCSRRWRVRCGLHLKITSWLRRRVPDSQQMVL